MSDGSGNLCWRLRAGDRVLMSLDGEAIELVLRGIVGGNADVTLSAPLSVRFKVEKKSSGIVDRGKKGA